jgi:hypothetical protein
MVTVDDLKKLIQGHIDQETQRIEVHDLIRATIKEKWEGKSINKRLANQVKDKLTELYGKEPVVYYGTDYGLYYITVWGTKHWPNYDNRVQFFMGHANATNSTSLSSEVFHSETDGCHGDAATKRNERKQALLNDNPTLHRIARAINKCRSAWDDLEALTSEFETPAWEIRYDVQKLTGLDEARGR